MIGADCEFVLNLLHRFSPFSETMEEMPAMVHSDL
jgi:hypothetical protein